MSKSQRIIEKKRLYNEEGKIKCTECNEEKTLDNFSKSKGCLFGLNSKCKDCNRKKYETTRSKSYTYQKEEYKIKNETLLQIGRKICSKCRVEKSVNDFPTNEKLKCGYSSQCYTCGNSKEKKEKARQKRRENNPDYYDFIDEKKTLLQQGKCRCYKCKEIKSIEDYHNTKYISYCKDCTNENNRKRQREKVLERDPEFYIRQEERKERKKKWSERVNYDKSLLKEGKKKCYRCENILSVDDFETVQKHNCINCHKEKKKCDRRKQKERHKRRMVEDPEYRKKYNKYQNRKQKERHKRRMVEDPEYRKKYNEKCRVKSRKKYYNTPIEVRREKDRVYDRKRRANDPLYNVKKRTSTLIRNCITRKGYSKKSRTHEILGCSDEVYFKHLESQFVEGMSWENRSEWHIDHIIPMATAKTEEEVYKLNHYTNLQPLWAKDNLEKSDKLEWSKTK
jgi:hypothetical protein